MATQDLAVRLKRKASPEDDTDMGDDEDAGGVAVPLSVSDEQRPSKRRLRLEEEVAALKDEELQESIFASETDMQGKPYLPKHSGEKVKREELDRATAKWTAGWLQHIDAAIRPKDLSRNLIHHLIVMSTFMSVAQARDGLRKRVKGNRPFGPADVKKVYCDFAGRWWASLKSEVFVKDRSDGSAETDVVNTH